VKYIDCLYVDVNEKTVQIQSGSEVLGISGTIEDEGKTKLCIEVLVDSKGKDETWKLWWIPFGHGPEEDIKFISKENFVGKFQYDNLDCFLFISKKIGEFSVNEDKETVSIIRFPSNGGKKI